MGVDNFEHAGMNQMNHQVFGFKHQNGFCHALLTIYDGPSGPMTCTSAKHPLSSDPPSSTLDSHGVGCWTRLWWIHQQRWRDLKARINGGFLKWGYPKIDGLSLKILLRWMMTGGTPIVGTPQIGRYTGKQETFEYPAHGCSLCPWRLAHGGFWSTSQKLRASAKGIMGG